MDEYGNPIPGSSKEYENIIASANACDFTWLENEFKQQDSNEDEKPDLCIPNNYNNNFLPQPIEQDTNHKIQDFFEEIKTIDFTQASNTEKLGNLDTRREMLERCISFIDIVHRNIDYLDQIICTINSNIEISKRNATKAHKAIEYERKLLYKTSLSNMKKKAHLAHFFKIGLSNCPLSTHLEGLYEHGKLILSYNGRFILEECVERNLWNQEFKNKLEQVIHLEVLDKIKVPMLAQLSRLRRDLIEQEEETIKNKIQLEIVEIQKELDNITKMPFKRLVFQFMDSDYKYDWLHIAKMTNKPDLQCQRFWNLMLKPHISRAKWTKEEDQRLITLAKKYEEKNWRQIATELDTNRNELQCFVHYQKYKTDLFKKGKWSKEEDKKLIEVIKANSIENMINWQKVYYSLHNSGRSNDQIYNRWMFSLKPGIKKGLLNDNEKLIITAAQKKNLPPSLVSMNLTNRTTTQIRNAYRRNLSYINDVYRGGWLPEEDKLLLKAVSQHALNGWTWSQISDQVPGRNAEQCRHRFKLIEKKIQNNPKLTIDNFPRAKQVYRIKDIPYLPDDMESVHNVLVESFKQNRESIKANNVKETDADRKLKKAYLENAYIMDHCNFSSKCELLKYVLDYLGANLKIPNNFVNKDDLIDEGLISMMTYLRESSNNIYTLKSNCIEPNHECEIDKTVLYEGIEGALKPSDIINSSMSEIDGLMSIRMREMKYNKSKFIPNKITKTFKDLPVCNLGSVPPNYETFKMLYTCMTSLSSCIKVDNLNPDEDFDWNNEESKKLQKRLVSIFRWPTLFSGMIDYRGIKMNMVTNYDRPDNNFDTKIIRNKKRKLYLNLKQYL
ncbi:uncharacterized protein LOC126906433 [Daktulosphaira vitifoliae]|uniref:uncharacterized protein LOC126906433 n=1 Tax=Daktulosphaira vitifoliae TaxID=58002 RepID=UPI0021A9877D|nr:uncharacterized protein LOC126906433 [Daktulosphaira vitifoliae]XP_050543010.1 uncharacterized protein LOC126906433 [Daktulosphaira vitifoliae]